MTFYTFNEAKGMTTTMIFITLDHTSSLTLTKQIYTSFRDAILNETLKPNEKLPSSRELAEYLNISRNIVINSYEQLYAEGYIYTKIGSGSYVLEGITKKKLPMYIVNNFVPQTPDGSTDNVISFRTGVPDLASIPIKKWGNIYREIALSIPPREMNYQSPFGSLELRKQLSIYLKRTRGVESTPENIMITTGAAQGFSLICQLIDKKSYALVENPLSYGLLKTLECNDVNVKPISVDSFGILTSTLPTEAPKLIFTTPSHQFPTGAILPIKRRIELIQYTVENHAYIIEDDYDSEFRFDGYPIQSMQSLAPSHVIYVGTFSKTFMPGIRLGYMILPDKLCNKLKQAKYIADLHSPILEQLTMAKFIEYGQYDIHLRKIKKLYLKRRNLLIKCLKDYFQDSVFISGANTGMHLIASFTGINFDEKLMERIAKEQININAVTKHYIISDLDTHTPYDNELIFGYGNTDSSQIEKGIKRLHCVLRDYQL